MTTPSTPSSISVVIPAYNEESRIAGSVDRVSEYLESRGRPFEIVVVDDGSKDATASRAAATGRSGLRVLRLPENQGKGAAVRRGVLASKHDLVLICDADLSTPIEELERLEAVIEEAPIVIASRQAQGSSVARTLRRRLVSRVFNLTLGVLGLCRGILDTQCGFKLLRGDPARFLFDRMELDGFAFDIELLELARHHGLGIREVGVVWHDSGESTVRFLRDMSRMLVDSFAVRRRVRGLPPAETPGPG